LHFHLFLSAFCHPNIWPTEDLPEMEAAFKVLATLVVETGKLVARQCDKYVSSICPAYPAFKMSSIIEQSRTSKARLLHYFKLSEDELRQHRESGADVAPPSEEAFSSWCGWHNDHGSLTGLVPAMYHDESNEGAAVPCPDPQAGLYIRTRQGGLVRVALPSDHLGFQIGETGMQHHRALCIHAMLLIRFSMANFMHLSLIII
jgi:hypothetical protein